jgi:hypothetical protein
MEREFLSYELCRGWRLVEIRDSGVGTPTHFRHLLGPAGVSGEFPFFGKSLPCLFISELLDLRAQMAAPRILWLSLWGHL